MIQRTSSTWRWKSDAFIKWICRFAHTEKDCLKAFQIHFTHYGDKRLFIQRHYKAHRLSHSSHTIRAFTLWIDSFTCGRGGREIPTHVSVHCTSATAWWVMCRDAAFRQLLGCSSAFLRRLATDSCYLITILAGWCNTEKSVLKSQLNAPGTHCSEASAEHFLSVSVHFRVFIA